MGGIMNTNDYRLKEKQANNISSVASSIDDLRSDLNLNSDSNSLQINKSLNEIISSIDAVGSQLSLLNKTMNRIANAMEANND
tara:strand:+ start:1174 stop:1422 length:249 start_codon:yes stop_codon:yes gene_type:complete